MKYADFRNETKRFVDILGKESVRLALRPYAKVVDVPAGRYDRILQALATAAAEEDVAPAKVEGAKRTSEQIVREYLCRYAGKRPPDMDEFQCLVARYAGKLPASVVSEVLKGESLVAIPVDERLGRIRDLQQAVIRYKQIQKNKEELVIDEATRMKSSAKSMSLDEAKLAILRLHTGHPPLGGIDIYATVHNEVMKIAGTSRKFSATFVPQGDGCDDWFAVPKPPKPPLHPLLRETSMPSTFGQSMWRPWEHE